ncbi:nuclear transport factor 2 family protein [Natrinema sp. SYSU A 869]|uniref:nuclear transport factor 2 family protein n=1 Tax=Natrinema sp. SYSU A 869 TaxID=2871694 RepID=UPI001CA3A307|nr:nuclear transport factor 2 family protein [Natrinema sp. SYSU A 869]
MAVTPQSNVEIVQGVYDGFNEGDIDSVLAIMANDIEWTEPDGSPFPGTYQSPTAVLENVFQPAMGEFKTFRVEPNQFIDGDDTVVALGMFRVTTEADEQIESPFAHVYELRDSQITRFVNYTDTALWQ